MADGPPGPAPTADVPAEFRKPLIAAINGAAAGLGLVQALYCDIRFSKPSAKLTTAFARRGLIAEYGMAWMLPRLVGYKHVRSTCCFSSRVVHGRRGAAPWGLVDRIARRGRRSMAAVAYAQELATYSSPDQWRSSRRQVADATLDRSFADAVAEADQLMRESLVGDPDVQEGVRSYSETTFTGLSAARPPGA